MGRTPEADKNDATGKNHHQQESEGQEPEGPLEIAVVGELTDNESDLTEKLLSVPPGESCILYFDSPGGNAYCGLSLMSLILLRGIQATGVVTGECSSAALWPFAACTRRIVTPHSVLLFHPMKWQTEEHVGLHEAAEWARHFEQLEQEMDQLLARFFPLDSQQLHDWTQPGCYISGRAFAEAGLAELIEFADLTMDIKKNPNQHPAAKIFGEAVQ